MGKSDSPFLLVPFLALVALIYPMALNVRTPAAARESSPDTRLTTSGKQGQVNPAKADGGHHRAAQLIEEYLDAQPGAPEWNKKDPRAGYTLDLIIATVPDPIDSRLPYFFDSFLDSIQWAGESAGYVLDRFDIAWRERPDGNKQAGDPRHLTDYEREPSILLFRNPGARKLLLVFLVGETPTSGIHKLAMASALQQVASFFPWGPDHSELPNPFPQPVVSGSASVIKVLGPSFSGSSASLEFALQAWLEQSSKLSGARQIRFRIVSGTATAVAPEDFAQIGNGDQASFNAVVPPDADSMQELIEYLQSFGQHKIAILSEWNTAYGQRVRKAAAKAFPEVLTLPFPLHISQLRTASEKARRSKQPATSDVSPSASASTPLPLSEEDNFTPKETPPFFSSLEASSAQLVLSNLLSTLSREDIHAVGILATDVRDTIFLSHEIRQHCPATLLFTLTSDLLYTHPDASSSTQGMLFVTPYPLFNLNQLWTPPFAGRKSRLQFPNQAGEGVYNAMLALLDREQDMLEYGPPFPGFGVADRRPALWVMAVGRQGPLPVKVLDWSDAKGYTLAVRRRAGQARPHNGKRKPTARGVYTPEAVFAVVVMSLFLSALSLLLIRQYVPTTLLKPAGRSNWLARQMGDPVSPQYRPQSRLYLFAACVALVSFYLLVLAAFSLPGIAAFRLGLNVEFPGWPSLVICILAIGVATQIGAIAVLGHALWTAPLQQTRLPLEVRAVILSGSLAGLFLALYLAGSWLRTAWQSRSEGFFVYLRAFDLGSGLSPLVPLFCVAAAAFLWGFCSFRRLRMIDGLQSVESRNPDAPFSSLLDLGTNSFAGTTDLERSVSDLLEGASAVSTWWYVAMLSVAILAGFYFFFYRFVRSFESGAFFILFGSVFFIVYWGLAMEFARLWLLWRRFSRLLRRLSWHPMRAAYARYHKRFQGFFRVDFAMPPPTFTVLGFSVDQAEQLLISAKVLAASESVQGSDRGELDQWISDGEPEVHSAGQSLSAALRADAQGDWRLSLVKRSEAQHALAKLTRALARLLEPHWRLRGHPSPLADENPQVNSFLGLGEEFLAGRAVLFISYVLPSLRNLGAFVLTGLLLMLFSVIAYPFQPRDQFLLFNWVVILCFVGAALVILLQVERDVVLSLLNGTAPGQVTVTRQFVFRIFMYVLLPVLALLSAQFPATVGQIASLIGVAAGHN
ncbi:MAG: hypothetical protein ACRD3T_07815 [Terriglobia bacterium]